jgi:hypothetical protein
MHRAVCLNQLVHTDGRGCQISSGACSETEADLPAHRQMQREKQIGAGVFLSINCNLGHGKASKCDHYPYRWIHWSLVINETNRIHLALFGMQNRTFDLYLVALFQ